jgi:hypothetical protein
MNRQEYLNNSNKDGSFHEYYSQMVTPQIINLVVRTFGIETLKECFNKDEHLNNIPLYRWDNLGLCIHPDFKSYGDYVTQAGLVCVLKTAAKIAIKNS